MADPTAPGAISGKQSSWKRMGVTASTATGLAITGALTRYLDLCGVLVLRNSTTLSKMSSSRARWITNLGVWVDSHNLGAGESVVFTLWDMDLAASLGPTVSILPATAATALLEDSTNIGVIAANKNIGMQVIYSTGAHTATIGGMYWDEAE